MNGFAATMTYSFHTSVFARTAAANYGSVVTSVATRASEGRGAYRNLPSTPNENGEVKIKFSQAVAGVSGDEFYARVIKADSGVTAADQAAGFNTTHAENWGGNDGTYANNMTTFYFRPTYIGHGTSDPAHASYGRCFIYQRWNGSGWTYEWRDESQIDPSDPDSGGWMSLYAGGVPTTTAEDEG